MSLLSDKLIALVTANKDDQVLLQQNSEVIQK